MAKRLVNVERERLISHAPPSTFEDSSARRTSGITEEIHAGSPHGCCRGRWEHSDGAKLHYLLFLCTAHDLDRLAHAPLGNCSTCPCASISAGACTSLCIPCIIIFDGGPSLPLSCIDTGDGCDWPLRQFGSPDRRIFKIQKGQG